MKKMLFRKLKKRKIQTIGIIAITFLWMFVVAFSLNLYSTNLAFKTDYFEDTAVEDFNFIPEDMAAVDALAEKYGFRYEEQYTNDFEKDGITYRLISRTENIDIAYVVEGKMSRESNEVMINHEFAEKNDISVGDVLKIADKEYSVSAFVTLVNYVKMHVTDTNYNYNPDNQVLVIMEESELKSFEDGRFGLRFLARFNPESSEEYKKELTWEILRSEEFISVTMQNDNSGISALDGKISVYFLLTVISLCVLSVIIVILLILFLYLLINEDRKQVGILRANGMKKITIWSSYLVLELSLLLPAGILGFLTGSFVAPVFDEILGQDISIPKLTFGVQVPFVLMIIGIITWLGLLSSVLATVGIVNRNITDLLKNNKVKKVSKFEKAVKKLFRPKNIVRRMRLSFAVRSKLLLILVLFSVFAAGVQFFLSYNIYNMNNRMIQVQEESMNFESQIYYQRLQTETEEGNQYFAQVEGVFLADNNTVQIYALGEGDKINIGTQEIEDNAAILNQTAAEVLKTKPGNIIKLAIGEKEVELKVQAVCDRIVGKEVFVNYDYMVSEGLIEEGYTGMFTDKTSLEENDEIATVFTRQEIIDNYKQSEDVIKVASVIMLVLGVLIPVILIMITVSVLISQNKREIILLKANGIDEKNMNRMIYGAYNVFLILGIAISIPYSLIILKIIFSIAVKASGIKYPVTIDGIGISVSVCMTTVIYYGTMFVLKKKHNLDAEEVRYDFG